MLEVEDTGVGIAPGELERIFEAFTRGSSCGSTRGSGLGLAITRHLAELHGGRMQVESRPGVGSTFRVLLPGTSVMKPLAAPA